MERRVTWMCYFQLKNLLSVDLLNHVKRWSFQSLLPLLPFPPILLKLIFLGEENLHFEFVHVLQREKEDQLQLLLLLLYSMESLIHLEGKDLLLSRFNHSKSLHLVQNYVDPLDSIPLKIISNYIYSYSDSCYNI